MAITASSPFRCETCDHWDDAHGQYGHAGDRGSYCTCHVAVPPVRPEPHELAKAIVVTSWTCPFCGCEQDVWGEGALYSWMECERCHEPAWLSFEAWLAEHQQEGRGRG